MLRLWRASIWHPDAIPLEERKYRHLKRVWLPVYDVFAMGAGLSALIFGSRLLNRILSGWLVDLAGAGFALIALVCLLGVAFPGLWSVEMVGKSLLVGMVVAYMGAIVLYPTDPHDIPNWFIVSMLAFGLPLACFRLTLLGEEWKERRAERA